MSTPTSTAFVIASSMALFPCDVQPQAVVIVSDSDMPRYISEAAPTGVAEMSGSKLALQKYNELKSIFALSHTVMSEWLGVKRRTLYNWMNDPDRASVNGPIIEERLAALDELSTNMESEHKEFLRKIAFSPIYGDVGFGQSILDGACSQELVGWYDKLFSKFEAYKNTSA